MPSMIRANGSTAPRVYEETASVRPHERGAEKGRWSAEDAAGARDRLAGAGALEDFAECELIIEAAPEALDLKRELFAELSRIAPAAVLASNTSSIPITS